MGSLLHLVQHPVSVEGVAFARFVLQEFEAGRAIGFSGVLLLAGQEYTIEIVGQCKNAPQLTRGLIKEVDDKLRKMIEEH